MVTNGSWLPCEIFSRDCAGLCDQMFHAALLVGVGLLGFPNSQHHGVEGVPQREGGFVQEGVGRLLGVNLPGEGAGPIGFHSGTGIPALRGVWTAQHMDAGELPGGLALRRAGSVLMVDRGWGQTPLSRSVPCPLGT